MTTSTDDQADRLAANVNSIIREAASSAEAFDQADKNEVGNHLLAVSKAVESFWKLMDEDLLFHPAAAQLLVGIEQDAAAVRMMIMAAIIERNPGALAMAVEIHRRERERK